MFAADDSVVEEEKQSPTNDASAAPVIRELEEASEDKPSEKAHSGLDDDK